MIPGSYVAIIDRGSLAELLGAEIKRRGLTQEQTAEVVGISQGTISKLLHRRRPSLRGTDVHQLADFLPEEARGTLEGAILGPEAREMLKAHQAWLDESLKPYREPPPIEYPEQEPELTRSVPPPPQRWNLRGTDAFTACDHLRSDDEAGQEIRRFEREAAKSGFTLDADELTTARLRLAFIRVFDPIAGDQGVVERHYEELRHTGELRKYLKYAFARELVLLRREPDLKRAQEWGALLGEVRPRFVRIVTNEDNHPPPT